MSTALLSGLIILVLLVIMLIAGVPIAVALGISSICAILPVMDTSVAVLTVSLCSVCWPFPSLSWQEIL